MSTMVTCDAGIGDGPWDDLQRFDDGLPKRDFDNFQFLELNKIKASAEAKGQTLDEAFTIAALEEVPDQYAYIAPRVGFPTAPIRRA